MSEVYRDGDKTFRLHKANWTPVVSRKTVPRDPKLGGHGERVELQLSCGHVEYRPASKGNCKRAQCYACSGIDKPVRILAPSFPLNVTHTAHLTEGQRLSYAIFGQGEWKAFKKYMKSPKAQSAILRHKFLK